MCLKKSGAHHVRLEEEGIEEEEQDGVELMGEWKLTYVPGVHITSTRSLASFPGPRPASRRLQYGKAGEGLVHFLT